MRANLLVRWISAGVVAVVLILFVKSWLGFLAEDGGPRQPLGLMDTGMGMSIGGAGGQAEDAADFDGSAVETMDQSDPRQKLRRKIVHLDLKGMPPRVSYLAKLFPLFKQMGVTGILLEYEDMFPTTDPYL
jgi:hypothetical protein